MNTQDLLGRIEPLLSRVNKPIQYVGGEHNSIVKEWQDVDVRWVLMYPDAYEVGQPNQGVAILYEVLNERDWICLLYTSPSPRDLSTSRMPSSA